MIYGYARVSTKGQSRDGNSLTEQEERLRHEGCGTVYHDSYTGTKMDRPEFTKLLSVLQSGDKLIVTKLDRFARTAADGIKMIQTLLARGISVHVLNMGLIDNTPNGKLMVTMLLAFAEFERDMILERTSAGKAMARANNPEWREGRNRISVAGFDDYLTKHRKGEMTVEECCKELGISRSTWYSRVRESA